MILLLQTVFSKVGGRGEAATGPLGGAPTRGAAAGLLRESDDAAAATAAAASAVKFMLIESEAAATSASFLPAQFSLLPFLRSTQQPPTLRRKCMGSALGKSTSQWQK